MTLEKSSQSGICIENVSFQYGRRTVLEAISLHVPAGEIWALIGQSGIGKTTLLQIVAGLFQPQTGSVTVDGKVVVGAGTVKGIVFQEESLLGWLTVEENIRFPKHNKNHTDEKLKAKDILAQVGLDRWENALPGILSTGMRKRAEFARALFTDNRYLLADEPFGTLDALTRRDLWYMWRTLRTSEPRTGILSTHDPEEAIRLCDVIVPLIPGTPARLGKPIRVPARLSALSPDANDDELFSLKEQLIHSLGINLHTT